MISVTVDSRPRLDIRRQRFWPNFLEVLCAKISGLEKISKNNVEKEFSCFLAVFQIRVSVNSKIFKISSTERRNFFLKYIENWEYYAEFNKGNRFLKS